MQASLWDSSVATAWIIWLKNSFPVLQICHLLEINNILLLFETEIEKLQMQVSPFTVLVYLFPFLLWQHGDEPWWWPLVLCWKISHHVRRMGEGKESQWPILVFLQSWWPWKVSQVRMLLSAKPLNHKTPVSCLLCRNDEQFSMVGARRWKLSPLNPGVADITGRRSETLWYPYFSTLTASWQESQFCCPFPIKPCQCFVTTEICWFEWRN